MKEITNNLIVTAATVLEGIDTRLDIIDNKTAKFAELTAARLQELEQKATLGSINAISETRVCELVELHLDGCDMPTASQMYELDQRVVALEESSGERELERMIERAIEDADIEQTVSDAVGNAMNDFDFAMAVSDAVSDAVGDEIANVCEDVAQLQKLVKEQAADIAQLQATVVTLTAALKTISAEEIVQRTITAMCARLAPPVNLNITV